MRKPLHLERRHFEFIADVIAEFPPEMRHGMAKVFEDRLATTNGQFKREKFYERAMGNGRTGWKRDMRGDPPTW